MKRVQTLLVYLKASASFIAALVRRMDTVVSHTSGTFPLLEGWQQSAEEQLILRAQELQRRVAPPAIATLYCFEGAHRGEVLPLRNESTTLGRASENSLVVTPTREDRDIRFYQLLANPRLRITAESGRTVRINGSEENSSDLYDYDQVELFGSRFLFLDVKGIATEEKQ